LEKRLAKGMGWGYTRLRREIVVEKGG